MPPPKREDITLTFVSRFEWGGRSNPRTDPERQLEDRPRSGSSMLLAVAKRVRDLAKRPPWRQTLPPWGIGFLCLVYFAAAKAGLRLAFLNESATPVWAPTGIALASLLVFGYGVWPAILLGAFVANLTTAGSVATCLGIAVRNTCEGLLG